MDPSAEEEQRARNRRFFRTLTALESWHRFRLRLFAEGIAVGILGGLCISLFRFLLEKAEAVRLLLYRMYLVPAAERGDLPPLLAWVLFLLAAAYVLCRMLRYAPLSGGSGIPQVKGVIMGLMKMKWFRILWVKIFGGALGIGIAFPWDGKDRPSRSAPQLPRDCPVFSAGPAWRNDSSLPAVPVRDWRLPSMLRWQGLCSPWKSFTGTFPVRSSSPPWPEP